MDPCLKYSLMGSRREENSFSDDLTAHYKLKNSFMSVIIFKQFIKRAVD